MNPFPLQAAVLAVLVLGVCPCAALEARGEEDTPRFALLIGVQEYANLAKSEQLDGCVNDVHAMRTLLQERFGFRDDQVVTLLNEQATGNAIRAQLAELAERVRSLPDNTPTAQVVFHFSGHGSQVPDQTEGPDRDELDGLDETLVPYDATKQGGEQDIRDDELFRYIEQICSRGKAHMWVVLDCCHSGTGARGATKIRKLHRTLDAQPLSAAEAQQIVPKRLPAGAVTLAACRDREVEPEYRQGDQSYGLLTRFLVQVLSEEENVSKLSYDLLRQAIIARYRQDPSVAQAPTPQLEGDAQRMRGIVLGATGTDRKPYWEVQTDGTRRDVVLMKAGAFHGVTVGSLYELYAQPETIVLDGDINARQANGDSLAWLRIEAVEGATARARAFQWQGDQQFDDRLPNSFQRGFAIERFHQHGDFGLRLQVVQANDENSDGPPLTADSPELPQALHSALTSVASEDESPWFHWVGPGEPSDLVLRIDGHHAALFPATGNSSIEPARLATRGDTPKSLVGGWGPPFDLRRAMDDEDAGIGLLKNYLRRITRARNLIRLATVQQSADPAASTNRPNVKLELIGLKPDPDIDPFAPADADWQPWTTRDDDRSQTLFGESSDREEPLHVMRDRDVFAFRVSNLDTSKVYVTVLLIDADMGIEQVLPWQTSDGTLEGDSELAAGQWRITDAFECNGGAFVDDPVEYEPPIYGRRWAIVLATREPNHFYMLKQESLPRVRSAGPQRLLPSNAAVRDQGPSSLESLLLQETFFQTRGDVRRQRPRKLYDESWSAATEQWNAVPTTPAGSPGR